MTDALKDIFSDIQKVRPNHNARADAFGDESVGAPRALAFFLRDVDCEATNKILRVGTGHGL